eukprot:TRINITY_DN527_c0_g1_i2.p1 TRINITY_DN527_c0_g1~~TRINITY_DN527_c0_g1_i2.p1  ORF type:complete len:273 (-),score=64.34 TRINITY_DN527_c0_g1_i2:1000-1782(-)
MADEGGWQVVDIQKRKREKRLKKKAEKERERMDDERKFSYPVEESSIPTSESVFAQLVKEQEQKLVQEQEREEAENQKAKVLEAKIIAKKKKKKTLKQQLQQQTDQPQTRSISNTKVDITELKQSLDGLEARYQSSPVIQLQSLTEVFEKLYAGVPMRLPEYNADNFKTHWETPISSVSDDVVSTVTEFIKRKGQSDIEEYLIWSLGTFIKNVKKEKNQGQSKAPISGTGLTLILQILCRSCGSAVLKSIPKIQTSYLKK